MCQDCVAEPDAPPPTAARIPAWLLLVTGVGMRGELEDRLRARVAETYGQPVELTVHHYGVFRSGAFFRWSQHVAVARLADRLRAAAAADRGAPDVIAHSFGAWLVGHTLDRHPDVRLGRVILTGSVLRPDFDWTPLLRTGRVEAVLNHYGTRDGWARASEFFIPESGPSGCHGFVERSGAINHPAPAFTHTTYFESTAIDDVYYALWRPFLISRGEAIPRLAGSAGLPGWQPSRWHLGTAIPRLAVSAALVAGVVAAGTGLLDVTRILLAMIA